MLTRWEGSRSSVHPPRIGQVCRVGLGGDVQGSGGGRCSGIVFPVIADGLSGTADADFDGQVTISELAQFLDTSLGSQAGMPLDRAGAVAANLVLSTAGREASAPVASPSPALAVKQSTPFRLKPAAVGLVSAGVISGNRQRQHVRLEAGRVRGTGRAAGVRR